ncbi:hypothetical protein [Haloterrigena salifodinae]|uniref:hypothetical protein n=1 Tax=Haloterrigena salifodinae TaxID=2675099 RepID=UPI000F870D57|nr:hypothetical protein [Haloterrigena salifodinae]
MFTDYSGSVSDPTTGTVITNATVEVDDPMEGALWTVEYEINDSRNRTYEIEHYMVINGTPEYRWATTLDPDENTVSERIGVPSSEQEAERHQLRIVRNETGADPTVVDSVNVTVRAE